MPLKQIRKKVSIDLNIRALTINNLSKTIEVIILWAQRTKALQIYAKLLKD